MSKERETVTVSPQPSTAPVSDETEKSPEQLEIEAKLEKIRLKKNIAAILDRGLVNDRLHVPLPPDVYGQWVRDDPTAIDRMKNLGFKIDDTYAPNRSIHSDGTSAAKVADVIFMTAPRQVKDLIDEYRNEQMLARNSKSGKQKEEEDFKKAVHTATGGVIPATTDSSVRPLSMNDLQNAIRSVDAQTKPQG
jgi:hypothetical protein